MNFRQNGDKYLITIEVIALIVVLVFGAVHFVMPGNKSNKKITESQQETQNPTQETDGTKQVQVDGQQTAPAFTPSDSVKTKLSSMTTEEKVAQLFITRPEEITGVSEFTQAGNKTKAAIGTYPWWFCFQTGEFLRRGRSYKDDEQSAVIFAGATGRESVSCN